MFGNYKRLFGNKILCPPHSLKNEITALQTEKACKAVILCDFSYTIL